MTDLTEKPHTLETNATLSPTEPYTAAELAIYGAMIAQQVAQHIAEYRSPPDEQYMEAFCEEADAIVQLHREANGPSFPPDLQWHPITTTEPADDDADVLLACNGSVIGILTARWTDGAGEENWKVDDNLWDADDAPTHYMRLPSPPSN